MDFIRCHRDVEDRPPLIEIADKMPGVAVCVRSMRRQTTAGAQRVFVGNDTTDPRMDRCVERLMFTADRPMTKDELEVIVDAALRDVYAKVVSE